MISLKNAILQDYNNQFDLKLIESTYINNIQTELTHFRDIADFEEIKKQMVTEFQKPLFILNELRKKMDHFSVSNGNIEKKDTDIKKSFDAYDAQEKECRSELANLLLPKFSEHFKKENSFSKVLLNQHLFLEIAELSAENNIVGNVGIAKDQFDYYFQLIKDHYPLIDPVFEKALETIKNSYLNEPELSEFIFIAGEDAFSLLNEGIKNNLLNLNIEEVKQKYSAHQVLFLDFYRESIINLVHYYQDYKKSLVDIKGKLEFLETHVGDPIKNWLDNYRQQIDTAPLSITTQKDLKSKCDALSQFKKQLKMDNSKEFLKEVKSETQKFLKNEIEILNQQSLDYQTALTELSYSFIASDERDKLVKTKQSQYTTIQSTWLDRENRLALVNELDDLKNFKQHFPEERLFISDSLDFEKIALHSAFLLLEESNPINKNENLIAVLSKISIQDLAEKIFFILENKDLEQLSDSINNLLQFIHSERSNAEINDAKTHLANELKNFFTSQIEKTAFCIVQAIDNPGFAETINEKKFENLLTYLRFIELNTLEKWSQSDSMFRSKIDECFINKGITSKSKKDLYFDRLISTKKLLDLFGEEKNNALPESIHDNSKIYSVWEACCLFQKFSASFHGNRLEYPFIKQANTNDPLNPLLILQSATINLEIFTRVLMSLEERTYSPTFFLNASSEKQKVISQLITNLKNISITQANKKYINDFFETWKDNNKPIINKPRYRFLVGLVMIIYRAIKEYFNPRTFETTSVREVNYLQHCFLEVCGSLEKFKSSFDTVYSAFSENQEVEDQIQMTRSLN